MNDSMMTNKLTIRLNNRQLQVLNELKDKLGCSISLIIRTIVGSWLTTNEEIIESLLTRDNNDDIKLFEDVPDNK